jgi:hypothetical protein
VQYLGRVKGDVGIVERELRLGGECVVEQPGKGNESRREEVRNVAR